MPFSPSMYVMLLWQAPLFPKPGSSVIIPVTARSWRMSMPISPSDPVTSGSVMVFPLYCTSTLGADAIVVADIFPFLCTRRIRLRGIQAYACGSVRGAAGWNSKPSATERTRAVHAEWADLACPRPVVRKIAGFPAGRRRYTLLPRGMVQCRAIDVLEGEPRHFQFQLNPPADPVIEIHQRRFHLALQRPRLDHRRKIDLPVVRAGHVGVVGDQRRAGLAPTSSPATLRGGSAERTPTGSGMGD